MYFQTIKAYQLECIKGDGGGTHTTEPRHDSSNHPNTKASTRHHRPYRRYLAKYERYMEVKIIPSI